MFGNFLKSIGLDSIINKTLNLDANQEVDDEDEFPNRQVMFYYCKNCE